MSHGRTLIVITGPTASGKTAAAIAVAQALHCDIINADSRQIFRGIPICTAAPTAAEQALVRHHFVEFKDLDQYYSAAQFESDVMSLLPSMWQQGDYAVMCGGSMMYIDAVCHGIDLIPDITPETRQALLDDLDTRGLDSLLAELHQLDPEYYERVDRCNKRRVVHALEVCRQTGQTYSSLRTGKAKPRDFDIIKVVLDMDRETLFGRINRRVDAMMEQGLEAEARSVEHLRGLNSLNTVGMKEMFAHFDGLMDLDTAVARIKKNTRVYAKKQLTWLARDPNCVHLRADDAATGILEMLAR